MILADFGGVDKGHGMGGKDSSKVWAKVREVVGPVCVRYNMNRVRVLLEVC